jgi:WD40 repeat protein
MQGKGSGPAVAAGVSAKWSMYQRVFRDKMLSSRFWPVKQLHNPLFDINVGVIIAQFLGDKHVHSSCDSVTVVDVFDTIIPWTLSIQPSSRTLYIGSMHNDIAECNMDTGGVVCSFRVHNNDTSPTVTVTSGTGTGTGTSSERLTARVQCFCAHSGPGSSVSVATADDDDDDDDAKHTDATITAKDAVLYIVLTDGKIIKLNQMSGDCEEICIGRRHEAQGCPVEVIATPKYVVCGGTDGSLIIWPHTLMADDEDMISVLEHAHDRLIHSLLFHCGILFTASDDCTIRVWKQCHCHDHFEPDSSQSDSEPDTCAHGQFDSQHVHDPFTLCRTLHGHEGSVTGLALDSSRGLLFSCSRDKTVRVWNLSSGKCIRVLSGHSHGLNDIVHDDIHHTAYTSCNDGAIYAWDTDSFVLATKLVGHRSQVYSLAWDRSTYTLYSASYDHTIRAWR